MSEPRRHRVTLRFKDDALEQRFMDQYVEKSRKIVRFGLILGMLVYGLLFGIIDWVQATNALEVIWAIRIGVCFLGLCVLLLVDSAFFERFMQPVLSGLIIVAGVGLLTMIFLDESTRDYIDGPVLVVLPAYVLFRIRFIYASIAGLIIFVLYCMVIYYIEGMRASELWASAVFLFAANLIGMAAGYELEQYARKEFWQTLLIDQERQENAELLSVKNRFFANISHEIRTPLTLILGPVEDALRRRGDTTTPLSRAAVDAMRRNGYRLLKFLDQLLELSRLDAERIPVEIRSADVTRFSKHLLDSFLPYAEAQRVSLEFSTAEPTWLYACDFDKLEVVLSNLISNAIKYTGAEGHVRVTLTRSAEGGTHFEVRDNGPGIAPEALAHLFERFYRAPETRKGNDGLGLGLSLTHALVTLMKGSIEVESQLGFGTVFTVELPPALADSVPAYDPGESKKRTVIIEPERPTDDRKPADEQEERPVVLVVDDHADVRAYIRGCLDEGYKVVEAGDGSVGFEEAVRVVPDLIVMDLMMPAPGGIELATMVRNHPVLNHVPIVMLTASTEQSDRLRGLEAGVDDYLTKPFHRNELLLRIQNLIVMRRQLREQYGHILLEPTELPALPSADEVFLARVREKIEAQLADEHFNADALADEIGMSVRQLQRKMKALTGETPTAQIRSMRLLKARHLVVSKFGTVAEIAYAVGFNNPTYFTKCFREQFGKAPTEWLEDLEIAPTVDSDAPKEGGDGQA